MKTILNTLIMIVIIHFLLKKLSFNKKILPNINTDGIMNTQLGNIVSSGSNHISKMIHNVISGSKHGVPVGTMDVGMEYNNDKTYTNEALSPQVIKGGNYYDEQHSNPNFDSNVLDVNQFYHQNDDDFNDDKKHVAFLDQHQIPTDLEIEQTRNKDNWEYANELVMNGGEMMKNVNGFDTVGAQYSTFNPNGDNLILESCDPYSSENMKDDIRFGKGKPNREYMKQR